MVRVLVVSADFSVSVDDVVRGREKVNFPYEGIIKDLTSGTSTIVVMKLAERVYYLSSR